MLKTFTILVFFVAISVSDIKAQSVITLNQTESGTIEHCATHKVHFLPGYSYLPTGVEYMHAYISVNCGDYVKLKNKLDGGYYYIYDKYVRFMYNEEYEIGELRTLAYNVFDEDHTLVGGVDSEGNPLVSGSSLIKNTVGENKFNLNLSALSLTVNEYYTLEVFNDKMEKKLLRFKVYN